MKEVNFSLDDIEVRKIDKNTYEAYNLNTGEILDGTDTRISIAIENQKKKDQINKVKKKGLNKVQGKVDFSEIYSFNWKTKSHFIKLYRKDSREFKQNNKLSTNAGLILLYLQDYIEYGTNKVAKPNGESFTNKEIEELVSLSSNTVTNALKELEDKNYIKRMGNKRAREIYFNPILASAGNEIEKITLKMFEI